MSLPKRLRAASAAASSIGDARRRGRPGARLSCLRTAISARATGWWNAALGQGERRASALAPVWPAASRATSRAGHRQPGPGMRGEVLEAGALGRLRAAAAAAEW